jgi:hypothetical protein
MPKNEKPGKNYPAFTGDTSTKNGIAAAEKWAFEDASLLNMIPTNIK